jgi:opacity protein-like surface antigen
MMKKLMALLAAATIGLTAGGTIANIYEEQIPCDSFVPYGYVGVGGVYAEYTENFLDSEVTEDNIGGQVQLGYMLFGEDGWKAGVEGRVGYVSLDYLDATYLNAYARVEKELGKFGVYGLLGYGTVDYSATFPLGFVDVEISDTASDFTYGAGVNYSLNEDFNVFIDYTVQPDFETGVDSIDSDVVALGVNYKW